MKKTKAMTKEMVVRGDSREVMVDYYKGKLLELEDDLNDLNILQHSIQIQSICAKMIAIKNTLAGMQPTAKPVFIR